MFGRSFRRIRAIGAFLALASLVIVPGQASAAAPSITSAEVFGNVRPGETHPADMGPETLFANSRPFGSRFEHGTLFVRGNATGDEDGDGKLRLWIDVVVEDADGNQVSRSVTAQPVDDPDIGRAQGDFNAELEVTELGQHVANGTDSTTGDSADWGGSELTVTITPRTTSGVTGAPFVDTLTKYAGTPNDITPPRLRNLRFPPAHWCHTASEGMQIPLFFTNVHSGSTQEGYCGDLSMDGFGALPDITWVACANLTPTFDYQNTEPYRSFRNNGFFEYCRTSPGNSIPDGYARVNGVIDDMPTNAYGVGSEIASMKIEVLQGTDVVQSKQMLSRSGPVGSYSFAWGINELAPNAYPQGANDPYVFKVTACDAWSNCSTATSYDIWVYPY